MMNLGEKQFSLTGVAPKPSARQESKFLTDYRRRAQNESGPTERRPMAAAAEFAYRQAFALGSRSPEAAFRCANHFLTQGGPAGALRVAKTAAKLAPKNSQARSLGQHLAGYLAREVRQDVDPRGNDMLMIKRAK